VTTSWTKKADQTCKMRCFIMAAGQDIPTKYM